MNIIYYKNNPNLEKPVFDVELVETAYRELAQRIADLGHRMVLVRDPGAYKGEGVFSEYWHAENGDFQLVEEEIVAHVVYDKGRFDDPSVPTLNLAELNAIFEDKFRTFTELEAHHIPTKLVNNAQELSDALDTFDGPVYVAKELDGNGGKAVLIGDRESVESHEMTYPLIAQQFIETSGGIPGLAEGRHDFRINIIDGKPVLGMIRKNPPGEYRSNIGFGSQLIYVDLDAIPREPLAIVQEVDKTLKRFENRLYSVDFVRSEEGKWYVVEANPRPITLPKTEGPLADAYMQSLADKLVGMLQ